MSYGRSMSTLKQAFSVSCEIWINNFSKVLSCFLEMFTQDPDDPADLPLFLIAMSK